MKNIKDIIKYSVYSLKSIINVLIPKNENYIYMFDKKGKKDNVFALAQYIVEDDPKATVFYYSKNKISNNFLPKNFKIIDNMFLSLWYQLRSRLIFYSYRGDGYIPFKSYGLQKIIDTTHGSPLKAIGYSSRKKSFRPFELRYNQTFDYILCTSPYFEKVIQERFGAKDEQCLVLGFPRNDWIFEKEQFLNKIGVENNYKKTILWMPTWRNPVVGSSGISAEKYSYPLLNLENIKEFNEHLVTHNVLLVIKPHPFQMNLPIFQERRSNILVVNNEDLNKYNIELYKTFDSFDALITDYSSVFFDFILTDKPIAFTVDDYDLYKKYQGFSVDEPLKMMPGKKIADFQELKEFINELTCEIDPYKETRESIKHLSNTYIDNGSSKRIINRLKQE